MAESIDADAFIIARLKAPPAVCGGRVYVDEPAASATLPYVLFSEQGGFDDVSEVGAVRIWAQLVYLVRIVGAGVSYAPLRADADLLDARLDRASGPAGPAGYVDSCVRERSFRMPERTPGGATYRHLGGLYRLRVRAATA